MIHMFEDVLLRLATLGYAVTPTDTAVIMFAIDKVTLRIKNECNINAVPDGLYCVAVDMVCGEILSVKKSTGKLDTLDVEAAVKSIKEGDTQVTYAVSDSSLTFDGLIDTLLNGGVGQFATYRCFSW